MRRTALVVDDDPSIRTLLARILQRQGYEVAEASDGMEALDRVAADQYDVILLDLMMPRLDGFGVIDHVQEKMPELVSRIIIATAYPQTAIGQLGSVCRIIQKPFDVQALVTAIDDCVHC